MKTLYSSLLITAKLKYSLVAAITITSDTAKVLPVFQTTLKPPLYVSMYIKGSKELHTLYTMQTYNSLSAEVCHSPKLSTSFLVMCMEIHVVL